MDKRKEVLIGALQDSRDEIRRAAAAALEKLEIRERLPQLERKISSGEMLEKIRAVYALTDLRGQVVLDLLSKAASDPSEDVRAASARVLGNFSDQSAVAVLVELLKDQSPIVVRASLDALRNFRDPRLLGPLMHALKHSDTGVVERALDIVGRVGDKRCEEAMLYFAAKGNLRMKEIAIRSLGSMDR